MQNARLEGDRTLTKMLRAARSERAVVYGLCVCRSKIVVMRVSIEKDAQYLALRLETDMRCAVAAR